MMPRVSAEKQVAATLPWRHRVVALFLLAAGRLLFAGRGLKL
jgi:hypothetical protein